MIEIILGLKDYLLVFLICWFITNNNTISNLNFFLISKFRYVWMVNVWSITVCFKSLVFVIGLLCFKALLPALILSFIAYLFTKHLDK